MAKQSLIKASANLATTTKSAESDDKNQSDSDESRISTEDFDLNTLLKICVDPRKYP